MAPHPELHSLPRPAGSEHKSASHRTNDLAIFALGWGHFDRYPEHVFLDGLCGLRIVPSQRIPKGVPFPSSFLALYP